MSDIVLNLESDLAVLPPPQLPAQARLADSLRLRASTRTYAQRALSPEQLSALLWAAFGVNRPVDGGRTAPSARNWQEAVARAQGSTLSAPAARRRRRPGRGVR